MPPKKKRKAPANSITHVVGAFPLHLITLIAPNGETEHFCCDSRLSQEERTLIPLTLENYDRLVRAAHAEATDNLALFVHSAIFGPEEKGEVVFQAKELS